MFILIESYHFFNYFHAVSLMKCSDNSFENPFFVQIVELVKKELVLKDLLSWIAFLKKLLRFKLISKFVKLSDSPHHIPLKCNDSILPKQIQARLAHKDVVKGIIYCRDNLSFHYSLLITSIK